MGEVHAAFERLIKDFGGTVNSEYGARVLAIKVDGVPLADHRADKRKPDSNFYGQGFVEVLSVARVLVLMGLDGHVDNIVRRDAPDLRVDFDNREPIFIEHSAVTPYDGMTFDRYIDELNIVVRRHLETDIAARAIVDSGYVSVRLTDPGGRVRPRPEAVATEVVAAIATLSNDVNAWRPDPKTFAALGSLGGNIYYRSTGAPNGSICNQDAGWTDPRPTWVGVRLREALAKKADDAAKYAPTARPLWLLLTVESEHLFAPFVPDLVNNAMAGQSIDPFDRVIIWSIDCPLFVFDADA